MRIAVLGTGAMGMLYAAMLSRANDVTVLGRDAGKVEAIRAHGIALEEQDGTVFTAHPQAARMGESLPPFDLVLVFVKGMGTIEALTRCQNLIGEHTLLLTLQNGGGHEEELAQFAPMERVLIGTTLHNASVRPSGAVFHGGSGETFLGSPLGAHDGAKAVAAAFEAAGVAAQASDNVRAVVWKKLLTNASLSALTGVFQIEQGFIAKSPAAWALCETLVREACDVARADGVAFDVEASVAAVRAVSVNGPRGITSICSDLMHGRTTEVESISGSVVRAARRLGVPAPHHEMMVQLIHAMEDKNKQEL